MSRTRAEQRDFILTVLCLVLFAGSLLSSITGSIRRLIVEPNRAAWKIGLDWLLISFFIVTAVLAVLAYRKAVAYIKAENDEAEATENPHLAHAHDDRTFKAECPACRLDALPEHMRREALREDPKERANERGELDTLASLILLAIIAVVGIAGSLWWNSSQQTMTCKVTEKQATAKKDGTRYLVYTENCGQLEVADSWLNLKFNSTDTYAGIKAGQSYTFHTVGWRNGLFSQFPNILDAEQ